MFRVTQYMKEIANPTPLRAAIAPPGPVVIWNLVRRCNLACQHCYSISADIDFPGELSIAEVFTVMDDLKRFVKEGLPEPLAELLDANEQQALLVRAQALADYARFPEDRSGYRYPWPLV